LRAYRIIGSTVNSLYWDFCFTSCSVCGREISEDKYESYDGMCWECWDDQLTEESEDMFGEVM